MSKIYYFSGDGGGGGGGGVKNMQLNASTHVKLSFTQDK